MKIKVTVLIQKEEDWYVSKCVEDNIASQGKTIEEAIDNLKEALELYYEDEPYNVEHVETLITTMEIAI
ncbi:MAG TPA: type II toxin-antitoxin system HicB family antitoxin [Thermotogota bacterium]|nr:type II toxin-antitoxin system HicB family antitoxin [Thermotogota bacterium]